MRCKFCGQEMEKTMIGEHYNFRDCANYLKAELTRRDEIIARLKEAGENLIQLANFGNKRAIEYTDLWSALMKELE